MRLFLKFDDGEWEELGEVEDQNDSSISYWISRRIEKSYKTAVEGWLAEKQIDVQKFVEEYHRRCERSEKEQREMHDKREYERLKQKYEK